MFLFYFDVIVKYTKQQELIHAHVILTMALYVSVSILVMWTPHVDDLQKLGPEINL